MLSKTHSLRPKVKNALAISSILYFAAIVCLTTTGCHRNVDRDSSMVKTPDSETPEDAKLNSVDFGKKGAIDVENDLAIHTGDRIEVLTDVGNDRDRDAINAAIRWLRARDSEPLDVTLKLIRDRDKCRVLVTFVFRDEHDEPFNVVGGHCTLTISESGDVVDVLMGA